MLTIKMYTQRNGKFFVRILSFNEFEFTYSDKNYAQLVEIDIKSDRNHLQLMADINELQVTEGLGANEKVNKEKVNSLYIRGAKFEPDQIGEIAAMIMGDKGGDNGSNR